jgi:hypothetical protein
MTTEIWKNQPRFEPIDNLNGIKASWDFKENALQIKFKKLEFFWRDEDPECEELDETCWQVEQNQNKTSRFTCSTWFVELHAKMPEILKTYQGNDNEPWNRSAAENYSDSQ